MSNPILVSLKPKQDTETVHSYPDGSILLVLSRGQALDLIERLRDHLAN